MKFTLFLIWALLPTVAFADTYRETRSLELTAGGIKVLRVSCGAGSLAIKGKSNADRIQVTAVIEAAGIDKETFQLMADKLIELDLRREYDRALLLSNIADQVLNKVEARINLDIELPPEINVRIDDGSGSIVVRDISGGLDIVDDSGAIQIENIAGPVRITDGSGEIEIVEVRGDLEIVDGSGAITIQDVAGDVRIKDASGAIEINDIEGNVTVSDESGSIDIYKVQKNVFIRESESGKIEVDGVKGRVIIRQ